MWAKYHLKSITDWSTHNTGDDSQSQPGFERIKVSSCAKFSKGTLETSEEHSKALVFFAVSKQIPIVYSADRGRAEKKTIQRNHMFAIFALLLKDAILPRFSLIPSTDLKDGYCNFMVSNVWNIVFFFATSICSMSHLGDENNYKI